MNEQFTQTLIQIERFLKKFKFAILTCIVLLVSYFAYDKFISYQKEAKAKETNAIYVSLLQKEDEKKEQELLKLNPNLYSIYLFYTKKDKEQAISVVQDLILKKIYLSDTKDSSYLKDMEYLNEAYGLLEKNEVKQANEILNNIPSNSPFFGIANNLKHYQGK